MAKKKEQSAGGVRIVNRKARHDYHITEVVECGMALTGTEVKSLRAGQAKIDESFARLRNGELVLVGSTIALYPQAAAAMQHEPNRDRKLLVHRRQINQLLTHVKQKGKTVVPLSVYFHRGWALHGSELRAAVRDAVRRLQAGNQAQHLPAEQRREVS